MSQNYKIKVMFIIDYLYGGSGGGTETHLSYLTQSLDKRRFDTVVVAFDTADTPFVQKMKSRGVKIIHIPVGRYYTPHALKKTLALAALIKTMQIDIVQTYHFKADILGVLAARLACVKYIISSKRDVGDLKKKVHFFLNRPINRFVDGFIVVADKVGEVIAKQEKVSAAKIKTIYNGVDTKKFSPAASATKLEARQKIGLTEDDFVVGMVAVLRPEKNHDIFFRALKQVAASVNKLKAVVVGDGRLFNYYNEYCQELKITDRIIFTGATKAVTQYLQTLDVACLVPGSNEGFSNAILEKMAMGLPLVVTNIGGNAEAVIDGINGIVVPPDNSNAVAEAILQLYKNPDQRKKMGINSRKRAENNFSMRRMIDHYQKYYEDVL